MSFSRGGPTQILFNLLPRGLRHAARTNKANQATPSTSVQISAEQGFVACSTHKPNQARHHKHQCRSVDVYSDENKTQHFKQHKVICTIVHWKNTAVAKTDNFITKTENSISSKQGQLNGHYHLSSQRYQSFVQINTAKRQRSDQLGLCLQTVCLAGQLDKSGDTWCQTAQNGDLKYPTFTSLNHIISSQHYISVDCYSPPQVVHIYIFFSKCHCIPDNASLWRKHQVLQIAQVETRRQSQQSYFPQAVKYEQRYGSRRDWPACRQILSLK